MTSPTEVLTRELLAKVFLKGDDIEVGALQAPLHLPPNTRVKYVDRFSKEKLYRHYPELANLPLVDVDVVDDGESLASFSDQSLDFVVANHFLEHCEDPIGTLSAFLRVIRPQGVVYAAVPDKRQSFDCDRPTTTLAHLLRDHREGPGVSRLSHFEEWARLVEPNIGRVYASDEDIRARANELHQMNYSIHFHNWEPNDFLQFIMYCISELSFPMDVEFFTLLGAEMIIILRRAA